MAKKDKIQKYLVVRHLINSEATFNAYKEGVEEIKEASELTPKFKIDLGLKLTVDEKRLDSKLIRKIKELTGKLPDSLWILYDPADRGSGTSFKQALFNPTFSRSIVVNADLDQYEINTNKSLRKLSELIDKVEKEQALYGIGSRDVPVVLAFHESNSRLRQIHELFISLAIGSDKLTVPNPPKTVSPAYAEIGESCSGLAIVNTAHPAYPELARSVFSASQRADLSGLAADYYTALRASLLGKISAGYVVSKPNKFYIEKPEEQEKTSIEATIFIETGNLSRADLRRSAGIKGLIECALHEENSRSGSKLLKFFSEEEVGFVLKVMSAGLLY